MDVFEPDLSLVVSLYDVVRSSEIMLLSVLFIGCGSLEVLLVLELIGGEALPNLLMSLSIVKFQRYQLNLIYSYFIIEPISMILIYLIVHQLLSLYG